MTHGQGETIWRQPWLHFIVREGKWVVGIFKTGASILLWLASGKPLKDSCIKCLFPTCSSVGRWNFRCGPRGRKLGAGLGRGH